MAENSKKIVHKKQLKKKLFRLGLSMAKPLLWLGALLLIADGCALAGLIYTCDNGGFLPVFCQSMFCALTTAILLLTAGIVYQLCSLKARAALHLLEDMKGLLRKTEQTLHHHLQEKQEKDFRRTVRFALENMQTDTEEQKKILQQMQEDNAFSDNTALESTSKEQVSRLEKLSNFLNQSVDTFAYLQQIYSQLQELGITRKSGAHQEEDTLLQEILTEVNGLREQLEEIRAAK